MKGRALSILILFLIFLTGLSGCSQPQKELKPEMAQSIEIKTVFQNGERIPKKYTCDGADISPPIEIRGLKAKSAVILFEDPDAPRGTFTHWIAWNVTWNGSVLRLPEGVAKKKVVEVDGVKMVQGRNDFNRIGYNGPCPPSGTHRYYFKVYALDIYLKGDYTREKILKAMEGHVVQYGEVYGTYSR